MQLYYSAAILSFVPSSALPAEPANADRFPATPVKKGLQVQMIDDALALDIGQAALNVDLTRLIDPSGKGNGPRWTSGGKQFAFSVRVVVDLDRQVKPLSHKGVVVCLILLTYASGDPARDPLMLHPDFARGAKNASPIGMLNAATPDGIAWLTAATEFLAARYSVANGAYGRVWEYIAGNEVNSHWFWANMGQAPLDRVVAVYEKAVTECRFWLDRKNAPQAPNARVVTFPNLEVLTQYLDTSRRHGILALVKPVPRAN